jgi:hypothetical protein
MRRMRACATAGAVCAGLTLCAALFAACSSGSTQSQVPDQGAQPPPTSASPGPGSEGAASNTTAPTGAVDMPAQTAPAQTAPAKPKKAPEPVNDGKEMLSVITNPPPDGGVVMNNAMTASDAGASDRLRPILDTVNSKRDGYRCCFDLYARKNPGAKGRIAFQMKINPDGQLMESKIKQDESDVTAPEVESCMGELSKAIAWPKSPSGKDTVYTHRFEFKPRR